MRYLVTEIPAGRGELKLSAWMPLSRDGDGRNSHVISTKSHGEVWGQIGSEGSAWAERDAAARLAHHVLDTCARHDLTNATRTRAEAFVASPALAAIDDVIDALRAALAHAEAARGRFIVEYVVDIEEEP